MNRDKIKNLLTDIRFWIVLFFVLRLVGITNAPLEIGHNWRQSLTNMIARNFFDNGANLFFPMIDMAGEKSGIIGSEFPFFNYLIYLFSLVFDYSHWYGRLINLFVSSIGIFYFYKLVNNLLSKKIAFNATIILSVSIWFSFSRKIMPDTFSVSLLIIGLYYAYRFLKDGYKLSLIVFFIFCTLGMLCKIPVLSLFSVLTIVMFIKEINIQRKIALFSTAILSFLIASWWYFYWVPYLLKTYHYQLYFPKGIIEGIQEIITLWPGALEKFYFSSFHSYIAFVSFLIGVVLIVKSKNKLLMFALAIVTFFFIIFIIKTGEVFPLHSYYIIPFVPIMAIVAGFFLAKIPIKYQYILLCLIAIEAIANQQHDFFIKDSQVYKLKLEETISKISDKNDLIIINGGSSPQDIYFSHRKGWTIKNESLTDTVFLDSLANLGAKYLIIDKSNYNKKISDLVSIYSDKDYSIYELKNKEN